MHGSIPILTHHHGACDPMVFQKPSSLVLEVTHSCFRGCVSTLPRRVLTRPTHLGIWLLLCLVLWCSGSAQARTVCSSVPTVTFIGPNSVTHSGSLAPGTRILEATLALSVTCTGYTDQDPQNGGTMNVATGIPHADTGSSGRTEVAGINLQIYGTATSSSSSATNCLVTGQYQGYGNTWWNFENKSNGNCTWTINVPVRFIVSGTIGLGAPGNVWSTGTYFWINDYQALSPTFGTILQYFGISSPLTIGGSRSCSLSTPALSVNLPRLSTSALAAPNATAGTTSFDLMWTNCTTSASGFVGTLSWAFTPGPAPNLLSNTGSPAAPNAYIQILDNAMATLSNGGTSAVNIPASGGNVTQRYYARYFTTGGAGAGNVNGTATFTMTYN